MFSTIDYYYDNTVFYFCNLYKSYGKKQLTMDVFLVKSQERKNENHRKRETISERVPGW